MNWRMQPDMNLRALNRKYSFKNMSGMKVAKIIKKKTQKKSCHQSIKTKYLKLRVK